MVDNTGNGLFIYHTVQPKDNFYSIGRLYNIAAKEIASFNELVMGKGLMIGQVIKIPLIAGNFSQNSSSGRPVYYLVGEKEGLYRVSTKNNRVLMANLRKWNRLTNDNLMPGKKLIIGFLVSPEANKIIATNTGNIIAAKEIKEPPITDEPKKEISFQKQETIKPKTEEINTDSLKQQKKQLPPPTKINSVSAKNEGAGGYFKSMYEQQIKNQPPKSDLTATGGIFKTTSGWQDFKYYALIDNVDPGTIIRIINPTNNKVVFAKVLGSMSGVRQNQGFDVRISNAAASVLELSDAEKFIVRLIY
ncbi:MAG: hypothetical protein NVSMB67_07710 [Flavisolibacter sp.]